MAARAVEASLRDLIRSGDDGIPPGYSDADPEDVVVGGTPSPGAQNDGWAAASHVHNVPVGAPLALGGASSTGASGMVSDADHVHDITGKPTTKGDLWTDDGITQVRLPVGTDGDVLTAASGETPGLKWRPASVPVYIRDTDGVSAPVAADTWFNVLDVATFDPLGDDAAAIHLDYMVSYFETGGPGHVEKGHAEVIDTYDAGGPAWDAGDILKHGVVQLPIGTGLTVAFQVVPSADRDGGVDATRFAVQAMISVGAGPSPAADYINLQFYVFNPGEHALRVTDN